MKRFFPLLTAITVFVLCWSCAEEPVEDIYNSDVEFEIQPAPQIGYEAQTYQVEVTSNVPWKLKYFRGNIESVTPESADGNATLNVKMKRNDTFGPLENVVVLVMNTDRTINESFILGFRQNPMPATLELDKQAERVSYDKDEAVTTVKVTTNSAWKTTLPPGVTAVPSEGEGDAEVVLSFASNFGWEDIEHDVVFYTDNEPRPSETIKVTQSGAVLIHGNNPQESHRKYRLKYMDDGRWWFAENLRFIPEGVTVSSAADAPDGVWYPVKFADAAAELQFMTDDESVAKYGLLYTLDVATDGIASTITALDDENKAKLNKAQGICPDGWYIPNKADFDELLSVYKNEVSAGGGLYIPDLQAMDFWAGVSGGIMKANSTANPSMSKVFYLYSTALATYTVNAQGRITCMVSCFMQTVNTTYEKGRLTIANGSAFNGAGVRCIKELPAIEPEP